MAFALVAHVSGHAYPTTGIDTTGSSLIVVFQAYFGGSGTKGTLTDSKGNTWTQLTLVDRGGIEGLQGYYCINPSVGASHTFTITGGSKTTVIVGAFSSTATPALDLQTGNSGSSGNPNQGGSLTPNNTNSLMISAAMGDPGASAVSSVNLSYTITDNDTGPGGGNVPLALAYLVETSIAAKNPSWTFTSGSAGWGIANSVFYDTGLTGLTVTGNDSLSLSDSLQSGLGSALSDSLSLSDALALNAPIQGYSFSDSLNLSDLIASSFGLILSEGFTLSDFLAYGSSIPVTAADTLSLSDSAVSFLIGVGIGKADSLSFSDVLSIAAAVAKSLGDNILLSDFLAALVANLPSYSDTFNLSDATRLTLSLNFSSTDTLALSDAVQLALSNVLLLSKSDSLSLSDGVVVSLSGPLDQYIRHWLNDVPR